MIDIDELSAIRDEIKADVREIKSMIDQFKSDYERSKYSMNSEMTKILSNLIKQMPSENKIEANFAKNNRQILTQFANMMSKYSSNY